MSWAAFYSGYPIPEQLPDIQFRSHDWFVAIPCKGKPCRVEGWYDDKIVYIDKTYRPLNGFGSSVLVHEFVHYLQDLSGDFPNNTCAEFIERQKEAYLVQNKYLDENTTTLRHAGRISAGCK